MDQISGTTPGVAPAQVQDESKPANAAAAPDPSGFGSRGRIRRRARFLRKARELAYRDLGGLVFNLHRFGQRNDSLVLAKLTLLGQIDDELRTLESSIGERRTITVLREAGITACPRCAAIHGSEDRFCPNCGLSMGRHPDLPIAGAAGAASAPPPATPSPAPATAPRTPQPGPVVPPQPSSAPLASPATSEYSTTARFPAVAGAPPPASRPASDGRSPTPPPKPQPGPPTEQPAPVPAQPSSAGEDTEILRPPAQDS